MREAIQPRRKLSREARLFIAYWAVIGFVVNGAESVIRSLYLLRVGFGAGEIGLLVGVTGATAAILAIPSGLLGKRTNNRKLAILGAIFWTVGIIGLPMVEMFAPEFRFSWLIAVFVIRGIGQATFVPNFTAYLSSTTRSAEGRQFVFSRLDAAFPAGTFMGAVLGGSVPGLLAANMAVNLSTPGPYRVTLWIFASVAALSLILVANTRDHVKAIPQEQAGPGSIASPAPRIGRFLLLVIIFSFLQQATVFPVIVFFSLYMNTSLGIAPVLIGFVMGAGQLLGVGAALAVPALARMFGSLTIVLLSLLGMAIALAALAFMQTPLAASLSVISILALNAIVLPSTTTLHQQRVPEQWRSTASSIWLASGGTARMIVAAGSGAVIASQGLAPVFTFSSAATICSIFVFLAMYRTQIV